jgi:hypothetical protein
MMLHYLNFYYLKPFKQDWVGLPKKENSCCFDHSIIKK